MLGFGGIFNSINPIVGGIVPPAENKIKDPPRYFSAFWCRKRYLWGMRKELKEKLKQDSKRYKHYKQKRKEAYKRKIKRIRNDPIRYEKLRKKWKRYYEKITVISREKKMERRSKSPYWQKKMGYQRYKCHTFQLMARHTNRLCKIGKITALDLWSLAKKQGLRCPISGEKLTIENISVDHIIPRSKGGTNILENLRLVTRAVNTAKHTMSDAEFFSFCQNIVNHHIA
jgi:5-methylcytosine-specific restriction endonuclease McrA